MAVSTGSCHCGRIRFEVEGAPTRVEACNCSLCRRTGYLYWYVAPDRVRLRCAPDAWSTYRFGTHRAEHRFCPVCGVSPFRIPRSDPDRIAVNVRCLEEVDAEALPVERFDGRHWEAAFAATRGGKPPA